MCLTKILGGKLSKVSLTKGTQCQLPSMFTLILCSMCLLFRQLVYTRVYNVVCRGEKLEIEVFPAATDSRFLRAVYYALFCRFL